MANDVITPSNLLVSLVENEEFEEAPLDVNVFQRSCEEEPFKKIVCTRVDHLAWDHRLSPNPHALAIYLEFLLVEPHQKDLKNVNVKTTMFIFIVKLGFPVMAIIVGYKAQLIPFPWNIELNT